MYYPERMADFRNRPDKPPTSVGEVMRGNSSAMGELLKQVRRLQKLELELKSLLDPVMAQNTSVAAVHDDVLVIVASSAALATRLRMDSKSLINSLNSRGIKHIGTLQVKIAPTSRTPEETPRKRRQLPDIARQSLERFAEDVENMELQSLQKRKNPDEKDTDS